jgi:di/tricarboxylate transporter
LVIKCLDTRIPTEDETGWVTYGRDLIKASAKILDDEAKGLVALGSSLITLYIAALTFLKLPGFFDLSFNQRFLIIILPIIFWLLSIAFNLYVYFPGKYRFSTKYPDLTKKELDRAINKKYNRLRIGSIFFLIALILATFSLAFASTLKPQIEPKEVQFIVPKEQLQTFENMSLEIENNSQKTIKVTLVNVTNDSYWARIPNGMMVEFKKELVDGIIYYNTSPETE